MAAAVRLREDYEAGRLRELAKRSEDANQTRRLLALAAIYDGGCRGDAARIGGVGLQTVRDWVLAFNAEGPAGLVNGKAPGNTPLLTAAHRQALLQIVESGPIPAVHGVVRWRLIDLAQWVFEEFRISISKQTLSRELRALELRKLSARPRHHAQDAEALAAFKKRMARPVRKRFLQSYLSSLRQRIRPVGMAPAKMEIRAFWSS
jgi:transposase